jgi:hypothetical protein
MYEWANNVHEQADMCVEVQGALVGVDDAPTLVGVDDASSIEPRL